MNADSLHPPFAARSRWLRGVSIAALAAFSITSTWAQAPVWSDNFGLRGPTFYGDYITLPDPEPLVRAVAETADTVFYGGTFTTFGGKLTSPLVAVNKTTGAVTDIGATLGIGSGSEVKALAVVGTDLYADANGLKKWNGTTWTTVAGVGDVRALAVSGSDLYITGSFTGALSSHHVAKWTGATLTGLGGTDGIIHAIAAQGSNVYIAGGFSTAGGVAAQNVAKWTGSAWTALGAGLPSEVYAIAANATTVFAGGDPMNIGTGYRLLFEWNGSTWAAHDAVPTNEGSIRAIVAQGASAFIVGGFLEQTDQEPVFRLHLDPGEGPGYWKDNAFSGYFEGTVGYGEGAQAPTVSAISTMGTAVYIGGAFAEVRGDHPDYFEPSRISAINVAKWTGTTWAPVTGGDAIAASGEEPGEVSAVFNDGDNVYVAGTFAFAGGSNNLATSGNLRGIARWNKTARTWTQLDPNEYIYGSSVTELAKAGGNIYAVSADGGTPDRVLRMSEPTPGDFQWDDLGQANGEIRAMVEKGGEIHVAGQFTNIGGVAANGIAKWNGTAWSALGTGIAGPAGFGNGAYALAVHGSDLIVAGRITAAGGNVVTNVTKWNGTTWSAMGAGDDYIEALAVFGGEVHYGYGGGVKKWNGSAWTSVGGTTSGVTCMTASASKLTIGGYFNTAGGVTAKNVASWDGTAWSALGSGIEDSGNGVLAAATDGTRIWIGGDFFEVGGKVSGYFAEYGPPTLTFSPDIKISDTFDDGNIATNTAGVGHGFVKRGQGDSTENGGFLNNSPGSTATRVYMSNTADAVNPFSAASASTVLKFTYGNLPHAAFSSERIWLGYRVSGAISDHFHPSLTASAGFAQKVQGLYISLLEQNSSTYTRHGNLVAVSNTGVEKKLASWDWQNPSSLSGVVVTLTTTSNTYSLSFSGAAGAVPVNVTGALAGTLSGLGPITTNFDAGFHSQWLDTTIDSVLLRVIPPPSVTAPNVSVLGGTEVILGGNATGINGPVSARGFVYALASQSTSPTVGGANVTNISSGSGTGLFSTTVSGLLPGENYVFRSYVTDGTGTVYTDPIAFTTPVDTAPITTSVAATGGAVPGAGDFGSGIPSAAVWTALGSPAINDYTQVAFVGSYTGGSVTGKGVFVDGTQVLAVGAPAPGLPGVTISNVFDPLIDQAGSITFRATLKGTGITSANDGAFLTNAGTGTLRILAREGDPAVGTPAGAVWKSLANIATPGGPMSFLFTGQLLTGAGTTAGPGGVTTANDVGLWATDSSGDIRLLFREGDTVGTKTLKSFQVLTVTIGTQGSARSFNTIGTITWRATYMDNSTEILTTQVQ